MSIGKALAKARVERNVTQKQLAAHFHVKQAAISMIENDELEPSKGLLDMIKGWIASGRGTTISPPRGARGNYR